MRTEVVRRPESTERSPVVPAPWKACPLAVPKRSTRTPSVASVSPLSLSQDSNDSSSLSGSGTVSSTWERKISLSSSQCSRLFGSSRGRGPPAAADHYYNCGGRRGSMIRCSSKYYDGDKDEEEEDVGMIINGDEDAKMKRCSWITNYSEENYVKFHDECWGVPVFDDNKLFELLSLSGMLIDHNWSAIMKKRERYRSVFGNFEPEFVAKMEEKDIVGIGSGGGLMLAENGVRSIVNNARCIVKVAEEFGSFGGYVWRLVNYRPRINAHKRPKSVPIRSPKSELVSSALLRRGFRLVGPVIVYSFMQAAGMVVDHLVGCFRYRHCVRTARKMGRRLTSSSEAPFGKKKVAASSAHGAVAVAALAWSWKIRRLNREHGSAGSDR